MSLVPIGNAIPNACLPSGFRAAGVPTSNANDQHSLVGTASTGTFALTITVGAAAPVTTTAIAVLATSAAVVSAVNTAIGGTACTGTGGALGTNPVVLTFGQTGYTNTPVTIAVDNSLAVGGTIVDTHTTTGTTGSYSGHAAIGATYTDQTTGNLYHNKGTIALPTWGKVSAD